MRFLVDMNLSPQWCLWLRRADFDATHWIEVGNPAASDEQIMDWARENKAIVFTNDLDFGAILALTESSGPSVIQLREQDVDPHSIGEAVLNALSQCREQLETGAIVTVDLRGAKARYLPIRRNS